jgi:hypothetical protein
VAAARKASRYFRSATSHYLLAPRTAPVKTGAGPGCSQGPGGVAAVCCIHIHSQHRHRRHRRHRPKRGADVGYADMQVTGWSLEELKPTPHATCPCPCRCWLEEVTAILLQCMRYKNMMCCACIRLPRAAHEDLPNNNKFYLLMASLGCCSGTPMFARPRPAT